MNCGIAWHAAALAVLVVHMRGADKRIYQSPGMIIIEVDRDFDRFDSLLGLHDWESFLKQPTEEDKGKASKIFWCLYNTGRLVQKNGESFRFNNLAPG